MHDRGVAHDTGEGSISSHHRAQGGDLIWQVASGHFRCRQPDGCFDADRFATLACEQQVKMIELKLSQRGKPGRGGALPAAKVTAEIATVLLLVHNTLVGLNLRQHIRIGAGHIVRRGENRQVQPLANSLEFPRRVNCLRPWPATSAGPTRYSKPAGRWSMRAVSRLWALWRAPGFTASTPGRHCELFGPTGANLGCPLLSMYGELVRLRAWGERIWP